MVPSVRDRTADLLQSVALKVSLVYLVIGLFYIFFSDNLAFEITGGSSAFLRFSEVKGFGFIIVTTALLFCLISYFRTASEKQQQQLFESEARYKKLYESMMDAFASIDMAGRIEEYNPVFREMLGYSDEEIRGFTYRDITPEKWHAFEETILKEQVMLLGHSEVYEKEYRKKDGTIFPVELHTFLLRDDTGQPTGMWAIIRDITARKRMEGALRESEKNYRSLVENVIDIFYQTDQEGRLTYVSPSALPMLGYTSLKEILGRSLSTFWANPEERSNMLAQIEEKGYVLDYEVNLLRNDQIIVPTSVSARFRHDETGSVIGVEGVIRDISERKHQERALTIANQKLQLMNIVAWHDIQNKVTGLRGYAELSKNLTTDDTVKKFMEKEEEILKTIDRELQYTKEYQEIGIRPPQWVKVPETVQRIVSLKGTSLSLVLEINGLEIYCDPVIESVFSHLVDNTLKHGKKATKIRIHSRETTQGLTLIYEDDGIGIPYERKRQMFLRGVGSTTWFGLFFVHDILEICGMTVSETGEPSHGARFEINVPRESYRFEQKSGVY